MMPNGIERELLEEIAKHLVVKREELVRFLERKVENPFSEIENLTKALNDKGLITYVSFIGKTCIAITQKGLRECGAQKD
jgi:RNA-binding protein YhbY